MDWEMQGLLFANLFQTFFIRVVLERPGMVLQSSFEP